jgi:hypothetical protein
MKCRMGFVTNSSATSYVVIKITLDEVEFGNALKIKIEKLLQDDDVEYLIELKGQLVNNWTGEIESEWDLVTEDD